MARRTGYFVRNDAFYDRGWNRACTPTQAEVWMLYLKHSDNDTGIATVKDRTLADKLGHARTSHVSEARKALVKLGLLALVNAGGKGRGDVVEVRVCVPEDEYVEARKGSRIGNHTGGNKVPDSGQKGSRFRARPHIDELPLNSQEREGGENEGDSEPVSELRVFFAEQLPDTAPAARPADPAPASESAVELAECVESSRYAAKVEDWMLAALSTQLRSPPFLATFGKWVAHLEQEKGRRPGAIGLREQIGKLNAWGPARATAAIEHSIAGTWVSLREPTGSASSPDRNGAAVTTLDRPKMRRF